MSDSYKIAGIAVDNPLAIEAMKKLGVKSADDADRANSLMNIVPDKIINEEDLNKINSGRKEGERVSKEEFFALGCEFEKRFPEVDGGKKFVGMSYLFGICPLSNPQEAQAGNKAEPSGEQPNVAPAKKTPNPEDVVAAFGRPGKPISDPQRAASMIYDAFGMHMNRKISSMSVQKDERGDAVNYTMKSIDGKVAVVRIIPADEGEYRAILMPDGKAGPDQHSIGVDILHPLNGFITLLHFRGVNK